MYSSPILMTQQVRFCGNPFRVDMYKGCDFGCTYCFANSNQALGHNDIADEADIEYVKNLFKKAFEEDGNKENLTIELLRKRVPLHCGGMSDPFQTREFDRHLTYQLIELTNKYKYPIIFSTKTAHLPEEYFKILNPEIHAFQVSIMGWTEAYIRKYEKNTPTAQERFNFVKLLRSLGFWCSVRLQPLVNMEEATQLVTNLGNVPSYITIEHLKIPVDNIEVKQLFSGEYKNMQFYRSRVNSRNIEIIPSEKEKNIKILQEIANKNGVKVGVGDNDLHHLSQSRCCCGVDCINTNFDNYLKYNLTYFVTGDYNLDDIWVPKSNCRDILYSGAANRMINSTGNKFISVKSYVDDYIFKNSRLCDRAGKSEVVKDTSGVYKKKLI